MSASELIEQAKQLSREDREQVIDSLLAMDFADTCSTKPSQKVDWSDTFKRTEQIFGDQTVPNLVLEERDSYKH
jgi:hypothetical protein